MVALLFFVLGLLFCFVFWHGYFVLFSLFADVCCLGLVTLLSLVFPPFLSFGAAISFFCLFLLFSLGYAFSACLIGAYYIFWNIGLYHNLSLFCV